MIRVSLAVKLRNSVLVAEEGGGGIIISVPGGPAHATARARAHALHSLSLSYSTNAPNKTVACDSQHSTSAAGVLSAGDFGSLTANTLAGNSCHGHSTARARELYCECHRVILL